MYIKMVDMRARLLFCAATLICTLSGGVVTASEHIVTVAIHVNYGEFDLNQPADARTFYTRIERAAEVVCTERNRVDLVRIDDYKTCYRKAVSNVIRSLKRPLLTWIYLETHTLKEAEAAGIDLPQQLAAK
jgi:UrcA family protein